jgi:hypothetical protein
LAFFSAGAVATDPSAVVSSTDFVFLFGFDLFRQAFVLGGSKICGCVFLAHAFGYLGNFFAGWTFRLSVQRVPCP